MIWYWQLVVAYSLDLVLGDPKWFPHPVRAMGFAAGRVERLTRRWFSDPLMAGGVTTALLLGITGGGSWGLLWVLEEIHPALEVCGAVYLMYTCLSVRCLYDESEPVAESLRAGKVDEARNSLSQIVGRDTQALDERGVARATVETVSENTIDGIVAPLFYACLGGPILVLLYKCVNTMDSLFGYRNEVYERFGKIPARLDDVANWIPARVGGAIMVLASWLCGYRGLNAWRMGVRDGGKHTSPNAGIPEAVVAGGLGVQLGGPDYYKGVLMKKPFIGDWLRDIEIEDIARSHRIMFVTSLLSLLLFVGIILVLDLN